MRYIYDFDLINCFLNPQDGEIVEIKKIPKNSRKRVVSTLDEVVFKIRFVIRTSKT